MSYYNDHRVTARENRDLYTSDATRMTITYENDEGDTITLEAVYDVCPTCEGRGTHTNPSIDAGGITGAEFDEDPDLREEYFAGAYDVQCYECTGLRVVLVPSEQGKVNAERAEAFHEWLDAVLESRAADRRTRWYESGCPE